MSLFVGFFISFCGHRYFPASQFLFGVIFGLLTGYILIENITHFNYEWSVGVTSCCK